MTTPLDDILSSGRDGNPPSGTDTTQQPEAPATDAAAQTTPDTEHTDTDTQDGGQPGKPLPIGAIRNAEREKVAKRYTEQVASFEKRLDETNAAWERRMEQLLTRLAPPEKPQQAQQVDWLDNPEQATRQVVDPVVAKLEERLQLIARETAISRFTEEEVDQAEQAFFTAGRSGKMDPADVQKILNSPNRYAAAVQWHRRQQAQAEIGDDPAGYKTRLREELKAELLAELQNGGGAPHGQQAPAPVFPSNLANARNVGARSGPAWGGPQSADSIFAMHRAKGQGR